MILLRYLSIVTSETLARAGDRGRLVVQEARVAEGLAMTGHGVHGADITSAPAPHAEEKPQNSNDHR